MKVFALIVLGLVWITSLVILVIGLRSKIKLSNGQNKSEEGVQPEKTNAKSGVEVIRHEKSITININPKYLTNTIQLTMDTANNELKMHVLPGGIIEDPLPEPDVNEADLLSSPEEIQTQIQTQTQLPHSLLL